MPTAAQQLAQAIADQLEFSSADRAQFITEFTPFIVPGASGFGQAIAEALSSDELEPPFSPAEVTANLARVKPLIDALEVICAEDRPAIYDDEGVRRLDPRSDDLVTFCQAADLTACYTLLRLVSLGLSEEVTGVLDFLSSMIAVAPQLESTLSHCESHLPHMSEFQGSWRVLPALYEDAEQSGLLLMAPLLCGDSSIADWLGMVKVSLTLQQAATALMAAEVIAKAPLTNRPPDLDAIVSAETLPAAPALPKLRQGLPHLLQLQLMAHNDWPQRFARVRKAATEPLPQEEGVVSQANGYRAAGFVITPLYQATGVDGELLYNADGTAAMLPVAQATLSGAAATAPFAAAASASLPLDEQEAAPDARGSLT